MNALGPVISNRFSRELQEQRAKLNERVQARHPSGLREGFSLNEKGQLSYTPARGSFSAAPQKSAPAASDLDTDFKIGELVEVIATASRMYGNIQKVTGFSAGLIMLKDKECWYRTLSGMKMPLSSRSLRKVDPLAEPLKMGDLVMLISNGCEFTISHPAWLKPAVRCHLRLVSRG